MPNPSTPLSPNRPCSLLGPTRPEPAPRGLTWPILVAIQCMPNPSPTPLSPNRPYSAPLGRNRPHAAPLCPTPPQPHSALTSPTRPYSAPLGRATLRVSLPPSSFRFWGRRHWRQPLNKHIHTFAHTPFARKHMHLRMNTFVCTEVYCTLQWSTLHMFVHKYGHERPCAEMYLDMRFLVS